MRFTYVLAFSLVTSAFARPSGGWSAALEIPADLSRKGNVYFPSYDNQNDLVKNHKVHLSRLYINLNPSEVGKRSVMLSEIDSVFSNGKMTGLHFIPRVAYDTSSLGGQSPSIDVISRDMDDILSVYTKHKDQLYAVQAGFLGSHWGEWWSSTGDLKEPCDGTDPKKMLVAQKMRDFMQKTGVQVQLRYPRDVVLYGKNVNFGIHDDCILAQGWLGPDSGTFDKGTTSSQPPLWMPNNELVAQNWMRGNSPMNGGESCSDAGTAPSCELLTQFVTYFKVCYVNYLYPDTFRDWHNEAMQNRDTPNARCYKNLDVLMAQNCPASSSLPSLPAVPSVPVVIPSVPDTRTTTVFVSTTITVTETTTVCSHTSNVSTSKEQPKPSQKPDVPVKEQPKPTHVPVVSGNPWVPGATYFIGDSVVHGGKQYRCTIAHLSIDTWAPSEWTQALWASQ